MKAIAILALSSAALVSSGCPKSLAVDSHAAANQPVNSFESYAYQALLSSQASLVQAAKEIQSGDLPASLKPDYDRAIAVQNTCVELLKNYDAAARKGQDVTALQVEISSDIATLAQLLVALKPAAAAPPGIPNSPHGGAL